MTLKGLQKMIEKLQDKEKRVETTTECGKDDGLSRKLCIREAESGKQNFAKGT